MTALQAAGLFAIALAVVVGGFLLMVGYNAVIGLGNRADKAWANVEVALRQRHDQLPSLVAAVRDVMAFEQEVLEEVARQRARWRPEDPVPEQGAVSGATSRAVRSLFAVMERYPEIRSTENVLRLQGEIERLEEQIADRRELYNDQVFRFNTAIATLPMLVLAPLFGWRPRAFFEAGPDAVERPVVALHGGGPARPT
jgi:LemA protein